MSSCKVQISSHELKIEGNSSYFPHISFVISLNFGLVSRIYGPDFEGQANSARPLDSPFLTRTLVILGQHRDRSGLAEEDQPVVLRDRTLARE
jgi:hypothetical protein